MKSSSLLSDIIIKIMKEPILPNFLPFKATLPITMQKYIKVKEEIMLHIYPIIENKI